MTAEERSQSFFYKSVPRRAAVVAAGPIANFILAILIFTGIFMLYGKPATSARVDSMQAGSAAEAAGFKPGDIIRSIDGQEIQTFADMQRIVSGSAGQTLHVAVDRGGESLTLTAVPELKEVKDNFGNVHRVGVLGITRAIAADDVKLERSPPLTALKQGVAETWFVVERTMSYLGGVVSGRESTDQLGGPIRIAQVSGQVATVGIVALIHLTAVLSISIGLLNLFPIPLLDGGHLLFYAIEALRGRPLSERAQELGFRFGLAFVLMLMIFATYNDVTHLFWS
jgi:regulator of sigma E protease